MRIAFLSVLLVAWILFLGNAFAQGTDLFSIPSGAATSALGGAGASRRANLEALFLNPAGLASLQNAHVSASYNPFLEMSTWSATGILGFEKGIAMAAGIQGLLYGDIAGDIRFNGDLGRKIASQDLAAAFGLGIPLTPKHKGIFHLDLGLNGIFASQAIDSREKSDFFFGSGLIMALQWNTHHEISFGAGLREFQISKIADGPKNFYAGASYALTYPGLLLRLLADVHLLDGQASMASGLELGFLETFTFRAGYQFGNSTKTFSVGGGAKLHLGKFSPQLDYAFTPIGELGVEHKIQFTFSFDTISQIKTSEIPTKVKPDPPGTTNEIPETGRE